MAELIDRIDWRTLADAKVSLEEFDAQCLPGTEWARDILVALDVLEEWKTEQVKGR